MGGLYDGLRLIAHFIVGPVAAFYMKAELLAVIFQKIDTDFVAKFKLKGRLSVTKTDFTKVPEPKFCHERKYNRLLDKASSSIDRQLDLVRFLKRQQMLLTTMVSVLRPYQLHAISSLGSTMLIKDSSNESDSSDSVQFSSVNQRSI